MSNLNPVIIEEVESNDIPESELSEFVETSAVKFDESAPCFSGVFQAKSNTPAKLFEDTESGEDFSNDDEDFNIDLENENESSNSSSLEAPKKFDENWLKKFLEGKLSAASYTKEIIKTEDHDDAMEDDFLSEQDFPLPKLSRNKIKNQLKSSDSQKGIKKSKKLLPVALQGLMGQANLCYARGETDLAEKICLEIIRQSPLASEPYITLSQIYESIDEEKHMQFLLIAAHLNPSEIQWSRIADITLEKGNIKQAIGCLTKAIKCEPKNIDLRMKRIRLLESIGEEKYAQRCYHLMLPYISSEMHQFLIKTAKEVAHRFHKDNNLAQALDVMLKVYNRVMVHFQTEDINLLLELLINNGRYLRALKILGCHTSVNVNLRKSGNDNENETEEVVDIYIPDDLILDFRAKLAVILIHLRAFHLKELLINNLLKHIDVEEAGDCYLDIAEALMKENQFTDALRLLDPLVNSENFSLAAVWLRHADCLRAIKNVDSAIESYKKVVEKSQHLDARLTLSALLKQEGRMEEALEALTQDPETEILDPVLLREKCLLLKDLRRIDEYLENGYILLLRHAIHFRSRIELATCCTFVKVNDRINELKNMRKTRGDEMVDVLDTLEFHKNTEDNSVEQEWEFYLDLLNTCYQHKKFQMFQKLAFSVLGSKKMQSMIREVDFIAVLSCVYNKEEYYGYNLIKQFVNTDMKSPRLWNLFNLIILVTQDYRYYRYLSRAFDRCNINPMVYILSANYYLMSNTYKYALDQYSTIFKKYQIPLIALILSIIYAQIASQKYSSRKQYLVLQAISFIERYQELREPEALNEIYYNFGRLYHQMGILHIAKSYYEKALTVTNALIERYPHYLDLRMEIAFNLHLIYKASGNRTMARKCIRDYIVV